LLLEDSRRFLADACQTVLNQTREFVLAGELDLCVLLRHPYGTMAGDLRYLDARSAHLLTPSDVCSPERVRTETNEIAPFRDRCSLQRLTYARIPKWKVTAIRADENEFTRVNGFGNGLRSVSID
jgi:hypothetical protein